MLVVAHRPGAPRRPLSGPGFRRLLERTVEPEFAISVPGDLVAVCLGGLFRLLIAAEHPSRARNRSEQMTLGHPLTVFLAAEAR